LAIKLQLLNAHGADGGDLFEPDGARSQLSPLLYLLDSFVSDGGVEDLFGLFFVRKDFVDLFQEDMIVVVDEINLLALICEEDAFADVQTIEKSIVVIEDILQ
jgi:hypothetical protein